MVRDLHRVLEWCAVGQRAEHRGERGEEDGRDDLCGEGAAHAEDGRYL